MRNLSLLCVLSMALFGCSHSTEPPLAVPFTAKSKLDAANSLAQSHKQGLRLMSVVTKSAGFKGEAATWQYAYHYPDTIIPPKLYWFHADANGVGFDSVGLMGVGSAVITHSWFNSDSALFIAEQNGGSQFRSNNPTYVISASVGEPVVPNPTTFWWVYYYPSNDNSKFLLFTIDANTGTVKTYVPD